MRGRIVARRKYTFCTIFGGYGSGVQIVVQLPNGMSYYKDFDDSPLEMVPVDSEYDLPYFPRLWGWSKIPVWKSFLP